MICILIVFEGFSIAKRSQPGKMLVLGWQEKLAECAKQFGHTLNAFLCQQKPLENILKTLVTI